MKEDWYGNPLNEYTYPDTNMGGNWRSTNPKAEQEAMKIKMSPATDCSSIHVSIYAV